MAATRLLPSPKVSSDGPKSCFFPRLPPEACFCCFHKKDELAFEAPRAAEIKGEGGGKLQVSLVDV